MWRQSHISLGLIPAWAGKTYVGERAAGRFEAHPRVGGENREVRCFRSLSVGSSPRGRGKLLVGRFVQARAGLIPAWAGKTPHP